MYKKTSVYVSGWGGLFTGTDDAGVLVVSAVVGAPAQTVAARQHELVAGAVHVVQEDLSAAVAEVGVAERRRGPAALDLPAHHLGVLQAPVVVAHRAPAAPVVHLHAALAAVPPPHQLDGAVAWREGKGVGGG